MWAAKLAGRVREGVFSSTCCRCSAIAPCWTFVCQCTSPLRYSGPLRVRCHECCRSFPIGMFPVATEPGMQNRTRLRFHRLHRQTGLYHQQCSPHSKGNSQHMPQHLSPCHSELLSCFAHHRTRTRHDGTTHRRRCVIESPHSRHHVGLCTLNACTSRRARGEGRPRGRIPPRGIALLACWLRCLWVGCVALFAAVRAAHACRWTAKRLCGCAGSPCVGTTGGLAISSMYIL